MKCEIKKNNPLSKECEVPAASIPVQGSCSISSTTGKLCPTQDSCSPFDLSEADDSCVLEDYTEEILNIGAAKINVYKLLGVHEQDKLIDLTGNGVAISNGDIPNFSAQNAFDMFDSEWRSLQLGSNVGINAFLGYDFGEIKLKNGRVRYGLPTFIRNDVATIRIMQGCDTKNRASKIRLERSDDGNKWYGVKILDVPDCDGWVTLNFNKTVPSRFWRIRAVKFNGGSSDYWSIKGLQLSNYEKTDLRNIQDRIFLENRDKNYDQNYIEIKGQYTPLELQTFQSKFGMSQIFGGGETYSIEVSFAQCVNRLGRPLVIGDIIELPSETQFNERLEPIAKYLEVTDVAWSAGAYTPNYKPTLQKILAEPLIASQETQDILGKLTEDADSLGTVDINDGVFGKKYQDPSAISQTIMANSNDNVPERGEDFGEITQLSKEIYEFQKETGINFSKVDRNRSVFGIDAMPPNGLPFTEGKELPPKNKAKDGDYHRLTYDNNIPTRLYRFSKSRNQWIYMETDRRFENKNTKPRLQDFLDPKKSTLTNPYDLNKS